MPWPTSCPPDLRRLIEPLLEQRNRPLAADVWTNLREWLITHDVPAPELGESQDRSRSAAMRDQ